MKKIVLIVCAIIALCSCEKITIDYYNETEFSDATAEIAEVWHREVQIEGWVEISGAQYTLRSAYYEGGSLVGLSYACGNKKCYVDLSNGTFHFKENHFATSNGIKEYQYKGVGYNGSEQIEFCFVNCK